MKNFRLWSIMLIVLVFINCEQGNAQSSKKSETKIQVAILLDTSNSMDGLIDQAKSRLWNIVNTLTTLKFKGKTPEIEIALYEYGNNNLSSKSGCNASVCQRVHGDHSHLFAHDQRNDLSHAFHARNRLPHAGNGGKSLQCRRKPCAHPAFYF